MSPNSIDLVLRVRRFGASPVVDRPWGSTFTEGRRVPLNVRIISGCRNRALDALRITCNALRCQPLCRLATAGSNQVEFTERIYGPNFAEPDGKLIDSGRRQSCVQRDNRRRCFVESPNVASLSSEASFSLGRKKIPRLVNIDFTHAVQAWPTRDNAGHTPTSLTYIAL